MPTWGSPPGGLTSLHRASQSCRRPYWVVGPLFGHSQQSDEIFPAIPDLAPPCRRRSPTGTEQSGLAAGAKRNGPEIVDVSPSEDRLTPPKDHSRPWRSRTDACPRLQQEPPCTRLLKSFEHWSSAKSVHVPADPSSSAMCPPGFLGDLAVLGRNFVHHRTSTSGCGGPTVRANSEIRTPSEQAHPGQVYGTKPLEYLTCYRSTWRSWRAGLMAADGAWEAGPAGDAEWRRREPLAY